MATPKRVVDWVNEKHKRPRVDPEWLGDCYAWLTTEGGENPDRDFQALVDAVENQLLESSFSDSMLPGTGLPTHAASPNTSLVLKGTQVLVEVVSITEIANSAFNLDQTRQAREERLKDGNVEDEDGEGDIDIAGEGPIPKYPRGMLKFHLTDGAITLQAIEYRPLPELSLENTPLGFKMLLKDVRIQRGIAYLEPNSVTLIGHKTDDRDDNRLFDFSRGLRRRMGLPKLPQAAENNAAPQPPAAHHAPAQLPPPTPAVIRTPLREISPPPSPPPMHHGNDEELEPRRRRVPNHAPILDPLRPESSSKRTTTTSSYFTSATASGSTSRSQTLIGSEPSNPLLSLSPTLGQTRRPYDSLPPSPGPEDEHFWSDEDLQPPPPQQPQPQHELHTRRKGKSTANANAQNHNSAGHTRNTQATRSASTDASTKAKVGNNTLKASISMSSDEFDDGFMFDNDMLAGLDAIEALNSTTSLPLPTTGSSSRTSSSMVEGGTRRALDVITIEDDSDGDDKENLPVPTRHVRRRFDGGSGNGSGMSQGSASQRARDPGRPVVLARTASDVIDLSDSE
ncbi:hypothetical protein H0H81_008930 [Sphagnurus paluster]|uniref:RecQ-mediated genome instability protein 1 n=1 Tax=Sphagnurus paluster TaxID=117069 RepID=A0A9P7KL86_9AGAR|nr:hypothetical protein H0H81_008930 [Sphagnurus paluster]